MQKYYPGLRRTAHNIQRDNLMENLTENQRYTLLLGLAATAKTKSSHFESHELTDSLIDLEDFCFIEYEEKIFKLAESLQKLNRLEILDLIIETANQLKQPETITA
ncbi:hypothetical protein ACL6C3_13765 [Capilliphycus salinus ALCB114379]|uniref:hypothetical protein n=1 Tax=Capilliphycus salinus TaxID=2768948 RepID=UPI0039A52D72